MEIQFNCNSNYVSLTVFVTALFGNNKLMGQTKTSVYSRYSIMTKVVLRYIAVNPHPSSLLCHKELDNITQKSKGENAMMNDDV